MQTAVQRHRGIEVRARDREPHRVAESAELLGMAFQLGGHPLFLTNSN